MSETSRESNLNTSKIEIKKPFFQNLSIIIKKGSSAVKERVI